MRTQKELKALKIAGTKFDRRCKLTEEDKLQIEFLFDHRDVNGMTIADIAEAFGISKSHAFRCRSKDTYLKSLEINRPYIKRYQAALPREELAAKKKKSYENSVEYKSALLDIVDKYSLKNC